jgi:NAD(P)-dependent dehydrogenase (short-subunit alcohol dehydrogenase family)
VAILDRDVDAIDTGKFTAIRCDITSTADVDAAVAQVVAELGGVDILINNAGIGAVGDVSENSDQEWHRVFDVNVVGIARVTRAALPHLRRSTHAAVVNTCSVVANVGVPQRAVYAASKGAVLALTFAMAADHIHDGIRINAVTPGTADTPWVGRLLDAAPDAAAAAKNLRARQPMGRLVTAAEVANAIAYLASPLASSTTGTILAVDGGMSGIRVR